MLATLAVVALGFLYYDFCLKPQAAPAVEAEAKVCAENHQQLRPEEGYWTGHAFVPTKGWPGVTESCGGV